MTQVVNAVNSRIESLAASYRLPVVDLFGLANQTLTLTTFAGLTMLDSGGQSGKNMFLSDSFHPGTVLQGVLANAILNADQAAYGDTIAPISDQQIATWAGLSPKGPQPTYFDVNAFVIYSALVPEPSASTLAALGAGGLLAVRVACRAAGRRRRLGLAAAVRVLLAGCFCAGGLAADDRQPQRPLGFSSRRRARRASSTPTAAACATSTSRCPARPPGSRGRVSPTGGASSS